MKILYIGNWGQAIVKDTPQERLPLELNTIEFSQIS